MSNDITPVFVKIEEYKEVLDILEVVKSKIHNAKGLLEEIRQLKDEEDRELAAWTGNLDDITNKIQTIDKAILGK